PEALAPAEALREVAAAWLQAQHPGATTNTDRDQIIESISLDQPRFDAVLVAAERARAALNRAQVDLEKQIEIASTRERQVVVLLSLAAAAVILIVGWLTYHLHRLSRELYARAEGLRRSEERFRLIAE